MPAVGLADQARGSAQTTHAFPTPRPTSRPTPIPTLPAPSAPHYTTNPDECVNHGDGPNQCSWLTFGKAIDVYWLWKCGGKHCAIGGYHLRLAGANNSGHGKVVGTSTGRFIVQDEPKGGWDGACYVVTAYPLSSHGAQESKPSPKICIHETSKIVTIKAHKVRGYARQYWVLYSDNNPQVQTYPVRTNPDLIVGGTFVSSNQSQANTFQRAAYAFDLSSIRGNSLFGGSFAYNKGPGGPSNSCAELHRAPNGWGRTSWIAPTDAPLRPGKFTKSGSTLSWPIDRLVEHWNRSTPLALFLEEVYGVGPAEFIKSGVVPYSFTCQSVIINPRLILKVGITV